MNIGKLAGQPDALIISGFTGNPVRPCRTHPTTTRNSHTHSYYHSFTNPIGHRYTHTHFHFHASSYMYEPHSQR